MRRGAGLLISCALLSAETAAAQTSAERTTPPQTVNVWEPSNPQGFAAPGERPTAPGNDLAPVPGSRPVGTSAGAFTVFPSITAATFYDDNVFSSNRNRLSDWAYIVRPELGFLARGPSHAVEGHAYVEGREYSKYTSENQVNGAASLGGTVMMDPNTQLQGRVGYLHAHEGRGVSESALGLTVFDKPVAYDQAQAAVALNKRFDRWWTSLGVAGQWVDYENPTISGVSVNQSYRDGTVSVASGRVGYVVAPLTSVFVEWAGNRRDFEVDIFDSTGYRVVGGLLLEPGPGTNVKGEAYAGYMHQDYTGVSFLNVSTFTYGGLVGWLLSPTTTLTVGGHRNALESGLNGGVSLVESVIGARIDHYLLPNLVLGVGATYVVDEFQGAGRDDHYLSPLVSLRYLVNPFVTLGFDYRNASFDSSGAGVPTYARNVYMLSLNARL